MLFSEDIDNLCCEFAEGLLDGSFSAHQVCDRVRDLSLETNKSTAEIGEEVVLILKRSSSSTEESKRFIEIYDKSSTSKPLLKPGTMSHLVPTFPGRMIH